MNINDLATQKIDWNTLPEQELKGETGKSVYKEITSGNFHIRLAEYSANYSSDHWCDKGHIIHCISGAVVMHLKNGNDIMLSAGESIILGSADPHKASTGDVPAVMFIIDEA